MQIFKMSQKCFFIWYNYHIIIWEHTTIKYIIHVSQAKEKERHCRFSPSTLQQCPVRDMWLCEPRGSSQTVPSVRRAGQGLDSGAQLRPPNWQSNQRRSVGTSCLTGPWPCRARPACGSCTVLWPTYQLMGGWQSCSHMKQHQLHLQTAAPCSQWQLGKIWGNKKTKSYST